MTKHIYIMRTKRIPKQTLNTDHCSCEIRMPEYNLERPAVPGGFRNRQLTYLCTILDDEIHITVTLIVNLLLV